MPPRVRTPKVLEGEIVEAAAPVEVAADEEREPTKFGPITVMASKLTDSQRALLVRLSRQADRDPSVESHGRLFEAFFAAVESRVSIEDAAKLEAAMARGQLSIEHITQSWGTDGEAPNRRTRRARK